MENAENYCFKMENNEIRKIKLRETVLHIENKNEQNEIHLEFNCICNHETFVGINSTHIIETRYNYVKPMKSEIFYFLKNASGYKIRILGIKMLKLKIYETCIDFFGVFITDEAEKTECLNLIEKMYIGYNQHHNIPLPNQQYNLDP